MHAVVSACMFSRLWADTEPVARALAHYVSSRQPPCVAVLSPPSRAARPHVHFLRCLLRPSPSHAPAAIAPPPSFGYPTDAAVASAIEDVAALVSSDIAASSNLDAQRAMAGPLLRKPFPISRLDSPAAGTPGLAAEFLPYKGSHAAYSSALASTNVNQAQKQHVVAVVQASGSGKTRLAYADGQEVRLVVIARVWKQQQTYTPAWERYDDLAKHWATVMPHLNELDCRAVSKSALAAMRLLAACHVRFVAEVLQRVQPVRPTTDASAKMQREAALRCLRNGKGDDTVGALFLQQLRRLTTVTSLAKAPGSAAPHANVSVALIDRAAVDRFCADADAQLRGLLWPGAEVAMWWDEAHALMSSPAVFEPFSLWKQLTAAPVAKLQDGFYGLTALCADLADKYRWLQSLCGTWMELTTHVDLPDISPLRGRVTSVFHASHISVDQMMETLHHYLVVDGDTEAALRPQLALLVGRPIFFFDGFMPRLWDNLRAVRPATAAALQDVLKDTAAAATAKAHERLTGVIQRMWVTKPSVLRCGLSSRSLCMQLYAALCMNGGNVKLQAGAGADALREGVLVLPLHPTMPASGGQGPTDVQLHDEPMCARVLQEIGRGQVAASGNNPSADPIFQLLGTSMTQGSIAGFGMTTSVKGDVLELAFAWYLVRYVLLNTPANGRAPTLSAALRSLSPRGFRMPGRAADECLVAAAGFSCLGAGASPAGATDLHRLCEHGAEHRVLYNVDENAGADVATLTVHRDGTPASVVMVQAKAQTAAALVECLRAASPAWQYTQEKQRKAAVTGDCFVPTAARAAFQEAATAPAATAARFSSAFRIALSVTGFRPETIAAVSALNALPEGSERSPIILCQPSERAFGKDLTAQLLASCSSGSVTSGTDDLAFLLPQAVGDVTAGKVVKEGSAAVQEALRGKP